MACNEGAVRCRPITLKQPDGHHHAIDRKDRIDNIALRACYLCDEINGQPGVFESESLYHMLVQCPHPSMVFCRERLKHDVVELSSSGESILQSQQALEFNQSH